MSLLVADSDLIHDVSDWIQVGVTISSIIGGIVAGIFYSKQRYRREEKKAVEEAGINCKNSSFQTKHTIVHETLTGLRVKVGADRARIGHFHNGGKFLDGSPMKKFSITHESCERGISYDGQHLQNILVTMFWDLVEVMRSDQPRLHWGMDMKDGYYRSYNNSHGVVAYSVLPIKRGDLFIGFILLEWFDGQKTPTVETPFDDLFLQSRDYIQLELALR